MQNDPFNPNQAPQDQPMTPPEQPVQQPQQPPQFQQPQQPMQQPFAQAPVPQPPIDTAYQQPPVNGGGPKKSKAPLIIALSAVGVLAIAGAVVFFILMNNNENKAPTGGGPAVDVPSKVEGGANSEAPASGSSSAEIDLIKSMVAKAYGVVSAKVAAAKGEPKRVVVTVEAEESPVSRTTFHAVLAATLNGAYTDTFTTATIEFVKSGAPDETAGADKAMAAEKGDKAALVGTPTSSAVTFNIRQLRSSME